MWDFVKSQKRRKRALLQKSMRRPVRGEILEQRCLMAANPLTVGLVYVETDFLNPSEDLGADDLPDRFIMSFTGGAAGTELTQLTIDTDKDSDGLSVGDLLFDTAPGGRGKGGWHSFSVERLEAADPRAAVTAVIEDGGTLLTLQLSHFREGDILEFTLDMDEVLRMPSNLAEFNSKLDEIVSGQEFEDSILTAVFEAPNYEESTATDLFVNNYVIPGTDPPLDLPPDDGHPDSRPNRTAAAFANTIQTPKPISISGTVFVDDNLNLVRESFETRLSDVQISLWKKDADGQFVDTGLKTVTDTDGRYEFGTDLGLMPGDYRIIESQPRGYFSVGAIPGNVAGSPSGSVETSDIISEISIPLGDLRAIEYDFAEARPARISGYVYRDDNDDGIRDAGEPGIAGVLIRLEPITTIDTQPARTTTTGADGSYSFANLSPGQYRIVEVDQPAPFTDGLDTAGTIDGVQVGVAVNPGDVIQAITLNGGQTGIEYNFGELPLGSLSGFVYLPPPGEDCDGTHSGDWLPIEGAKIELYTSDGTLLAETFSLADGSYRFDDLPKGEYRIVEITPAGLIDGTGRVGTIDGVLVGTLDGDGSLSNVKLPAGRDGQRYDFCEAAPARLEGYVYHDASNDGIRDSNEVGIPNAQVRLYNATGQLVATTQTNQNGHYAFENLIPGSYRIEEVTPQGYLDGLDQAGTIAGLFVGSAANPGDLISNVILKQGQAGIEYNFGELVPATIEGRVHADVDGDCELDADEVALQGVIIQLFDASGNQIAETTTDAGGIYRFNGLRPGKYTVVQIQPDGYFSGGQKAGSTGGNASVENQIREITLESADQSVGNNFCENPPSQLSGRVHADRDGDCIYDPGEPTLANVTIELLDANGDVISSTKTDANGEYSFTNLKAGRYTIRQTQPVGYLQGGQSAGSGGGDASQTDLISAIEIGWGETLIEYNFCELEPASLSGTVFLDSNGNCVHEPNLGENGLTGVTVRLHDSTGRIVATTITNANGDYRFENLRPGEYQVSEVQPTGLFHGGQRIGSGGGVVAGDDLLTQIQINAGDQLLDYDFCEVEPSSIQGIVHIDDDGDCVYEPADGEQPLPGVVVELLDGNGNVVARTQTNAEGIYRFDNLKAGSYSIREIQPAGLLQGGERVGSGGGRIAGVDLIAEIPLGPGQDLINYDFCEVEPSSIGGRVWSDTNVNRRYDDGETPLGDVLIELLDSSGRIVSTQRTSEDGTYTFRNLMPGTYTIREIQPTGFFHAGQIAGSNGGDDSVRDVISSIAIPAGENLINYDFPEQPPSIISGFVFQDGPTLELRTQPDPLELRQYRDGQFTEDDTPLEGVVLELRLADGRRAGMDVALPGTYEGDVIRVVTDENGYYEFTGLSSRVYSVYQVQPDGFIDGLDTEGTFGGLAVNAADLENDPNTSFFVQTLSSSPATDPKFDAILLIDVLPATHSQLNNFSEIKFEPPNFPPPPEDPPQNPPEQPSVGFDQFPDPNLLYLAYTPAPYKPYMIGSWANGVTWHLSIINGGSPRGAGLDSDVVMRPASSENVMLRWTSEIANVGEWRIFEADGTESKAQRQAMIGVVDGIPLVGDFNGDGQDEFAIYVGGQWLVDLNGNGVWDQGDLWIELGSELDRPVIGDWDGDGKDDIGIFGPEWEKDALVIPNDPGLPDPDNMLRRGHKNTPPTEDSATNGKRFLKKTSEGKLRADVIDHVFRYGSAADVPLAGDWNGDGIDAIAIFRNGQWLLDLDGDGRWTDRDELFDFGQSGDVPVVADFNGDGIDELAVVRGNVWIIDTDGDRRLTAADAQIELKREPGEEPIAGDWDGDGRAEPGYYRVNEDRANDPAA